MGVTAESVVVAWCGQRECARTTHPPPFLEPTTHVSIASIAGDDMGMCKLGVMVPRSVLLWWHLG